MYKTQVITRAFFVALCAWTTLSFAGDSGKKTDIEIAATKAAVGVDDEAVTIEILLSNPDETFGWSFAVCHDSYVVSIDSEDIVRGEAFDEVDVEFEFIFAGEYDWSSEVGFTGSDDTLGAGDDIQLYEATYLVEGGGISEIEICDLLGEVPIPPFVETKEGVVDAALQDGRIVVNDPDGFFTLTASDVSGAPGDEVEVVIELSSSESCVGFDFGLEHDGDIAEILEAIEGSALEDLNDGTGPGFFDTDLDPECGPGFTVSVWFAMPDGFETLSSGEDQEIVIATYVIDDGATSEDLTDLDFSSLLGDPFVSTFFYSKGDFMPETESGSISVVGSLFRRGDPDGDDIVGLGDALFMLRNLADSETVSCTSAMDLNDSGTISIADVLFLLCYLYCDVDFEPSAPFKDCGVDPTDDTLPCSETPEVCTE